MRVIERKDEDDAVNEGRRDDDAGNGGEMMMLTE